MNTTNDNMTKYHVALSFAGEDREYVEKVAIQLQAYGVDVFYDKFEEANLWGKDLYEYLSHIYQDKALFTVMFISEAYNKKHWANHERSSAQSRAIMESKEYILPAFFDESIKVPGLLRTIGHISLKKCTPVELADLIVQKLENDGVELRHQFSYSERAKEDIDFPITPDTVVSNIIKSMKSYDWYTQNPAVIELFRLDWATLSPDETFVLGRNLYQCACGSERKSLQILINLRRELANFPEGRALDFLNGMFFEVYFNSEGEFRGPKLKGDYLDKLLALQTVSKFSPSVAFIRRALEPYKNKLILRPNTEPEHILVDLTVRFSDPPTVQSLKIGNTSILSENIDDALSVYAWRLSFGTFTVDKLAKQLADEWSIPLDQLNIQCNSQLDSNTKLRLKEGWGVAWSGYN